MATISDNLQAVTGRIAAAARACGRNADEITLLAVSKTFGVDAVSAALACGQHAFGENYVQEALDKIAAVRGAPEWHYIGPIQSNKTRQIAESFAWVHSVDRLKIAERLSAARPPELPPLQLCIQVNIGDENTKSGVAPADTAALARSVAALPRLRLRGLMTIPPPTVDSSRQRSHFAALRELKTQIGNGGLPLDTLSMGMSADLEAAIAEGATIVRVGTAIFGDRRSRQ
ncbi:MAG: YggS family pyridoxal phosphate-dependent enzyme [Betaproteobacteria bacterium]|nr:YggS family pyridoxal phosphate-dependent enzyme [Betaproteobacteria bacterium]